MTKQEIRDLIIKSDYKNDFHRPVISIEYNRCNSILSIKKSVIWVKWGFVFGANGEFFDFDEIVDDIFDGIHNKGLAYFRLRIGKDIIFER